AVWSGHPAAVADARTAHICEPDSGAKEIVPGGVAEDPDFNDWLSGGATPYNTKRCDECEHQKRENKRCLTSSHKVHGKQRDPAAAGVRFVSERNGWLPFAPPCGFGATEFVAPGSPCCPNSDASK